MWDEFMELASRPIHGLTDAFRPLSLVATGVAGVGAIASDSSVAWYGFAACLTTVVIPVCIDAYRKAKAVQREQWAADLALDTEKYAEEVRKRVEIEAECRQLQAETARNRHRINDLEQQIVFMKAATEKIDNKVKRITTPDPDAPEPATD